MLKNLTITSRKHRILWRLLAGLLFTVVLVSMWGLIDPQPGPMTEAIEGFSGGKIGSWFLLAGFGVYGAARLSSYVTGTAASVVHSGRHLIWQMPAIITFTAAAAVALVLAVPLTGQILQQLSTAVLLSAVVRWLLEATDPANTAPAAGEELSGEDRTHEEHEPNNDSTSDDLQPGADAERSPADPGAR